MFLPRHWEGEQLFVLEYPYPAGSNTLDDPGESTFQFVFNGSEVKVTLQQLVFGGEPIVVTGSR